MKEWNENEMMNFLRNDTFLRPFTFLYDSHKVHMTLYSAEAESHFLLW